MKKPYGAFAAAAVAAVAGALASLDWSQILSVQTAGIVVLLLSGVGATVKAYLTPSPAQDKAAANAPGAAKGE